MTVRPLGNAQRGRWGVDHPLVQARGDRSLGAIHVYGGDLLPRWADCALSPPTLTTALKHSTVRTTQTRIWRGRGVLPGSGVAFEPCCTTSGLIGGAGRPSRESVQSGALPAAGVDIERGEDALLELVASGDRVDSAAAGGEGDVTDAVEVAERAGAREVLVVEVGVA